MKRVLFLALLFAVLGSASEAAAQFFDGPPAGREMVSVHLKTGLLAPMTTFDDPDFGETGYANGVAFGAGVSVWPALDRRLGLKVTLIRSNTDGEADSEWAPIVVNSPTVWAFSTEAAFRLPMAGGYPYISAGYGLKQYTWVTATYQADRDGALTGAVGYELRPGALGGLGLNFELRGYRTEYRAFGVNDGNWTDGPYGGNVGGVSNLDLLFTTGVSIHF